MKFSWKHSSAVGVCPSCGNDGSQDVFLEVDGVAGDLGTVRYSRCRVCAAVQPDRVFPPITTERKLLSYYLEQGAAIDIMTAPLMQVEGARRLLEVGCGFGFALDFARVALGLSVVGVDPSHAAEAASRCSRPIKSRSLAHISS